MKIIQAIVSTTHVDSHRECMAKSALDGMANQFNAKYIPQLRDHDPKQYIGVMLCARVAELNDGEYALYGVGALFDTTEEAKKFPIGEKNTVWKDYLYLTEDMLIDHRSSQNRQIPPAPVTIAERLERHLDSTSVWTDGTVYKIKHLIASTGDLSIHVYPKDHWPPHFHVISKQRHMDARFCLYTLRYLSTKTGVIKRKDEAKVQDFFKKNPEILQELHAEHARMQKE